MTRTRRVGTIRGELLYGLVHAATELGCREIADRCKRNLAEDQAMAAWLLQQVPAVVSHETLGNHAARE